MKNSKPILITFIIFTVVVITSAVFIALIPKFGELIAFGGLCVSIILLMLIAACLEGYM